MLIGDKMLVAEQNPKFPARMREGGVSDEGVKDSSTMLRTMNNPKVAMLCKDGV